MHGTTNVSEISEETTSTTENVYNFTDWQMSKNTGKIIHRFNCTPSFSRTHHVIKFPSTPLKSCLEMKKRSLLTGLQWFMLKRKTSGKQAASQKYFSTINSLVFKDLFLQTGLQTLPLGNCLMSCLTLYFWENQAALLWTIRQDEELV